MHMLVLPQPGQEIPGGRTAGAVRPWVLITLLTMVMISDCYHVKVLLPPQR